MLRGQYHQHSLTLAEYDDSETKKTINTFHMSESTLRSKLLIETLMEEVNPIIIKKQEIKNQDMSKLIAQSAVFSSSRIRQRNKEYYFSTGSPFQLDSCRLNP